MAASTQVSAKSFTRFLGVDTGGTFTDFVLLEAGRFTIHKVLSTPEDPGIAILQGIREMGLEPAIRRGEVIIVHGTTVATNAVLERKLARTVYVTNSGFEDVLTIGRQARPLLYALNPEPPAPPVAPELCLGLPCRRDAQGRIIHALMASDLEHLCAQIDALKPEAVAVNLLFSFLAGDEEQRIKEALGARYFVSLSSEVLPQYKEYERGMATWINASLAPKVERYMRSLREKLHPAPIAVMQSSGGTIAIDQVAERSVNLLLSGPAGGLAAMRALSHQCQLPRVMSFDMGGTSTDVALLDGDYALTQQGRIGHWPVAVPMLDMQTIGAGGGSIAWLDAGGLLHVGPQSAASRPGPACYGLGGDQPTVTDANVVLGRIQAQFFLGGNMPLDAQAAWRAHEPLAQRLGLTVTELAQGIVQLAEQQMVQALHAVSVQRGHDPQGFVLCCFGGAGGLHICALAQELGMAHAIVPRHGGVLSALGMLAAPKKRYFTQSCIGLWEDLDGPQLEAQFLALEQKGSAELAQEGVPRSALCIERKLELRYVGQSSTLAVPAGVDAAEHFVEAHRARFGHVLARPVELVNLNVALSAESQLGYDAWEVQASAPEALEYVAVVGISDPVPVFAREQLGAGATLQGPAIIVERVATTWLAPLWSLRVDAFGHLHLRPTSAV